MLKVQHKTNPFQKGKEEVLPFEGKTLRQCLESICLKGKEFDYPTIVKVDNVPWLRNDWDLVVPDGSTIAIIAVVGEVVTALAVINIVMIVASVAFTAYGVYKARKAMRALRAGQGQADPDPFFSVDGHANKANLNNPVEVAYGRNRMWPSYIGRPYRTYRDDRLGGFGSPAAYVKNTNFVQIFCLGQGDFDIHAVQVGDLLIESYKGMSYEIVRPGEHSLGLGRIMYVQPDFEPETLTTGQSTDTLQMSPPGTRVAHFEIDVESEVNGEYSFEVKVRKVNVSTGAVDSSASTLYFSRPSSWGTSDPNSPAHRHTFQFTFNEGDTSQRYAISVINNGATTIKILELRSYLHPATDPSLLGYSDKTLLIVSYFVTTLSENLAKDKINVIATRKLKTLQVVGGSRVEVTQPTRSIPWAVYDVLTNPVYGGGLSEEFIDVEGFSELHEELQRIDINFDYVFNQFTTVSDAVKVIAAAGRCSIAYNGSRLTLVRDAGHSLPEAMFSLENIIPGSFSWSTEMFDPTEPDAIEASYVDTDSGEEHTTIFTPEGSIGNNVQKLNLQGVSSREIAWHEAAHKLRKLQLVRDTFKFKTGMEGYVPSIGATALLSVDMAGMGVSGFVEDYVSGWLYLSRPVSVATSAPYGRVVLRRDDGSVMGPFPVTATAQPYNGGFKSVYIGVINFDIDFLRTDKEPVHFVFDWQQPTLPVGTKIQIENVTPMDEGVIEITATNFDPKVYEFDVGYIPEHEEAPVSPVGLTPVVPWLRAKSVDVPRTTEGLPYTQLQWGSCFGASFYTVYVNNVQVYQGVDTSLELELDPGEDILVEVSGTNLTEEGTRTAVRLTVGVTPSLVNPYVQNDYFRIEADCVEIWWNDVLEADYYEVSILAVDVLGAVSYPSAPIWRRVEGNYLQYTKTMFKQDAGLITLIDSNLLLNFIVRAVINGVTTNSSIIPVTIASPGNPTNISVSLDPKTVINARYTRHRTITWGASTNDLPGTKYTLHQQAYYGTSSVLDVKPWNRITTTDKFIFSSDAGIPKIDVGYSGLDISSISEFSDPIYGAGCMATLGFNNTVFDVGDMVQNGLYVYPASNVNAGKFYTFIKRGTTQLDGIVWIPQAIPSDFTGMLATIVQPSIYENEGGQTWRAKGAIIAENGWFLQAVPSKTTFDSPV